MKNAPSESLYIGLPMEVAFLFRHRMKQVTTAKLMARRARAARANITRRKGVRLEEDVLPVTASASLTGPAGNHRLIVCVCVICMWIFVFTFFLIFLYSIENNQLSYVFVDDVRFFLIIFASL